ncbi:MAG TPA: hypothetical protein ENK86_04695, partial [Campylobacterales bacterium]|nr:hypothetical protein [Campylobacterales bacterium]
MRHISYTLLLILGFVVSGCGQVETTDEEVTGQTSTSTNTTSTDTSSSASTTSSSGFATIVGDGTLTISGKITFDRVPARSNGVGLNYSATTQDPARQIVVKAIDSSNSVIASTTTDDSGVYRLEGIPEESQVKVRAYAMMYNRASSG